LTSAAVATALLKGISGLEAESWQADIKMNG
jgi:hypothetical protein